MRTTTKLLCAAVLAMAGTSQVAAQYVSASQVADVSELTDGYYVIKGEKNDGSDGNTGFIYYQTTSPNYKVDVNKQSYAEDEKPDLSYVWKLTWSGEGENRTFTLRNAESGRYFAASNSNTQTMAGSEAANLRVDVQEESQKWFLGATNYQVDGQYLYVTINSGQKLGWWSGFANAADAIVTFYKVDGLVDVPYKYNVTNVGISFEQTASAFVGDAYAAPAVNFYTITTQPEGTVTGQETEHVVVNCTASYPGGLVAKGMTADGQFASDAKWYTLSVRGGQAVVATDDAIYTKNQTRQLAKGNMWTFVKEDGNPDGFKVYNLLKGADSPLYLSSDANSTDASFATGSEESGTTTFTITANGTGFNLQYPGTPNANLGDHHNGPLSVWNHSASAGDVGSRFAVAEVNDLLGYFEYIGSDYVGAVLSSDESAAALATAYENFTNETNTTEALTALCEFDYTNAAKLELTDGYYRIKCAPVRGNRNLSLDAANNRLSSAAPSETDASQIWKIAATDGGLYTLTAQGVAPVKGDAGAQVAYTEAGSETATTFYVKKGNVNDSQGTEGLMWFFDTTTGDINNNEKTALNVDQSSNVILMPNNYGASVWYIQKAETIGLTIGGALCGTFCYDFAVALPEGLTAFRAVSDDADAIYLESIDGGVVPAHTPVLVQADEAKTYELTILSDAAPLRETNEFEGTLLPEAIDGGVNAYILGMKDTDEAPRFYLVAENDRTMPANKAYYVANGSQTQAFRLSFDGTTTGIDSAVTTEGGETEVYYDLSGRRVLYPAKGIYVKANGQKVYLK